MPFIDKILNYKSLSIVGLEKNTGKTECLNYVLGRLPVSMKVAVTSIGIDGEQTDQVTGTEKPEIQLRKGMLFGTAEKHYKMRRLVSEVYDVSDDYTSLGRIVTAKVILPGKALISGPSSTTILDRWMNRTRTLNPDLIIVDGAISRLSSASPVVSESLILATGAALSANIPTLVAKTAFTVGLINLQECDRTVAEKLSGIENGIWVLDRDLNLRPMGAGTALKLAAFSEKEVEGAEYVFVSGALTDSFLKRSMAMCSKFTLLVRDFTKFFVTPAELAAYRRAGGHVEVLNRSNLVAVTVNPVSPAGYVLDSGKLRSELERKLGFEAYDLRHLTD